MPNLLTNLRSRLGIFSRNELLDTASLAYGQGFVDGKNQALDKLPKVLAEFAENKLRELTNYDNDKKEDKDKVKE